MSAQIRSKLIDDAIVNELDNRRITKELGCSPATKICAVLLKVSFERKTFYCCMAGGEVDAVKGDFSLTHIGRMTLDALMNLPVKNEQIVFQEVKIGTIPLRQKITRVFRRFPSGTKICFIGDMAGELDGVLFNVFNVEGIKND